MPSSVSLGCLLFLCLVTGSFSLCIIQKGTNSSCTNSSLVLVSQSQLEADNGLNLTITKLPSVFTNCSTTNEEKHVYVAMGNTSLDYEFTDINKTIMKVQIPGNTSGLEIISFSFQLSDPNCYNVSVIMNHEITVKAIDPPELNHLEMGSSHLIYCKVSPETPKYWWITFELNGKVMGYCCRYTISEVKHKNDLVIYYNNGLERCILKIEKTTSKNKGLYSCTVIIPGDDGDNDTKISSKTREEITGSKNNHGVEIGIPVGVFAFIFIIACIISWKKGWLQACFHNRRRGYGEIDQRHNGPNNNDNDDRQEENRPDDNQ